VLHKNVAVNHNDPAVHSQNDIVVSRRQIEIAALDTKIEGVCESVANNCSEFISGAKLLLNTPSTTTCDARDVPQQFNDEEKKKKTGKE
jgi:hypothetical protein